MQVVLFPMRRMPRQQSSQTQPKLDAPTVSRINSILKQYKTFQNMSKQKASVPTLANELNALEKKQIKAIIKKQKKNAKKLQGADSEGTPPPKKPKKVKVKTQMTKTNMALLKKLKPKQKYVSPPSVYEEKLKKLVKQSPKSNTSRRSSTGSGKSSARSSAGSGKSQTSNASDMSGKSLFNNISP